MRWFTARWSIVMLGILVAGGVFALSQYRPDLVAHLSYDKLSVVLEEYLPKDKEQGDIQQVAVPAVQEKENVESVSSPESTPNHSVYTADDIERATRELLQKKRQEKLANENQQQTKVVQQAGADPQEQTAEKIIYEIELQTGGVILTENITTSDGIVSYESDSGMTVSIHSYEIKAMRRLIVKNGGE